MLAPIAKQIVLADAPHQQEGNTEDIEKYSGMLTKVSRKDCEDVKALLRMMGVPVVEAPCEAEAQCGELVKGGIVAGRQEFGRYIGLVWRLRVFVGVLIARTDRLRVSERATKSERAGHTHFCNAYA